MRKLWKIHIGLIISFIISFFSNLCLVIFSNEKINAYYPIALLLTYMYLIINFLKDDFLSKEFHIIKEYNAMIYDKSITINTNLSLDNSKEKLKQLTFPYSKASKYKCDFIGRISDDSFDITLNLSGPREPIRTKVVGCFKSNNEGTIVYAKLKPSPVTLFFQIIYSCLCILFFIIFLLYNPSTILLPILMFCFGNLVMLIFIRSNFNTTENILQKAYCNKCEIRA